MGLSISYVAVLLGAIACILLWKRQQASGSKPRRATSGATKKPSARGKQLLPGEDPDAVEEEEDGREDHGEDGGEEGAEDAVTAIKTSELSAEDSWYREPAPPRVVV